MSLPSLDGGAYTVTLITGDRVSLTPDGDGNYQVEVDHADRQGDPLLGVDIRQRQGGEGLYVTPHDARPLIASGVLDEELFNVEYLAANGYARDGVDELPVIVEYADRMSKSSLASSAYDLPGSERTATFDTINAAGVAVEYEKAATFWAAMAGDQDDAGATLGAAGLPGGIEKVWLDRKVEVDLDESVSQIGAPDAWDAGFDGSGATVCVIDTGIDLAHPDVGAADEFTYEVTDEQGDTATATVHVTVAPEIDDPEQTGVVAVDDVAVTRQDTSVTIPVLDNDIGEDLRIVQDGDRFLISDPPNGTAKVNEDHTVVYTSDDGYVGNDEFQYLVADDGEPTPGADPDRHSAGHDRAGDRAYRGRRCGDHTAR